MLFLQDLNDLNFSNDYFEKILFQALPINIKQLVSNIVKNNHLNELEQLLKILQAREIPIAPTLVNSYLLSVAFRNRHLEMFSRVLNAIDDNLRVNALMKPVFNSQYGFLIHETCHNSEGNFFLTCIESIKEQVNILSIIPTRSRRSLLMLAAAFQKASVFKLLVSYIDEDILVGHLKITNQFNESFEVTAHPSLKSVSPFKA